MAERNGLLTPELEDEILKIWCILPSSDANGAHRISTGDAIGGAMAEEEPAKRSWRLLTPEEEQKVSRQCEILLDSKSWSVQTPTARETIGHICWPAINRRFRAKFRDEDHQINGTDDVLLDFLKMAQMQRIRSPDAILMHMIRWETASIFRAIYKGRWLQFSENPEDSLDEENVIEPSVSLAFPDPGPLVEKRELHAIMLKALKDLPDIYHDVLILWLEDRSYTEITDIVNISEGTVKSRISNGVTKWEVAIRKHLGQESQQLSSAKKYDA